MTNEKRIILWGAWYGSRNVGDRVLLLAITDMLQQALDKVHFIALSASPSEVYRYTRQDSNASIEAIRTKKDMLKVIKEMAKADLFIFGGGVPFFDSTNQLIAMVGLTFFARLFKTPYFLWSVSSLPISSWLAKRAFRVVLSGANGITYRDEHTRVLFQTCGVSDENMTKVADSAFSLKSGSKEDARLLLEEAGWSDDTFRPLVALTPRPLRRKDGEAETHYSPQSDVQYQHEIYTFAKVLDWLWENNYQPVFVPMNTVSPDDDRSASKLVLEYAKHGEHALIIDCEIPPRLAARIYQHCQASFVSRVHGSIMSLIGGCPPVMYAFDKKHKGIMEAMGLDEFIFDPKYSAPKEAKLMIDKLLSSVSALKKDISIKHNSLCENSYAPLERILELIE